MTESNPGRIGHRVERLQQRLDAAGIDLLILTPGTSWFYLTGVALVPSRLALMLIPRRGQPAWVVPRLEVARLAGGPGEVGSGRIWDYADGDDPLPVVGQAIAAATTHLPGPPQVAALEERVARVYEWRLLAAALPQVDWQPADGVVAGLRIHKDPEEQAAIRKAARWAETALAHGATFVQAGCRESQIAAEIEKALRQLGTWSPFGVHVASGPRSAMPHAETGDRLLEPGDLVWVDLGATVDGYVADVTRTFLLPGHGQDPHAERKQEMYRVCYQAQAAARAAARPGVPASQVDAAARHVIAAAGYGDYFIHRTGHGLGLDVHEAPEIAPGSETVLEPGMVFTVEPGIYVPGVGGVRIEDDILITAQGSQSLTQFRRWLAPGPAPAEQGAR